MIAGNPDHHDDASQDSSKHSLMVLTPLPSPQCLVLVTSFSGPGHSITLVTGNDTPLHNVTRLMEPPEEQHTADILIRSRLLIVTEF